MAKDKWFLKVTDLSEAGDAGDIDASPDNAEAVGNFMGEISFKGEAHWMLSAESKAALIFKAHQALNTAQMIHGLEQVEDVEWIVLDGGD